MNARPRHRRRAGYTLVELLVVIVLLGLVSTLGLLAFRATSPSSVSEADERLAEARRRALVSGKPVSVQLVDSGGRQEALTLPDGSVVTDLEGIDRLSGRRRDAYR